MVQVVQGTEVLLITKEAGTQPKGVLLLFHGCGHGALDWWYSSPSCRACTGATPGRWMSESIKQAINRTFPALWLGVSKENLALELKASLS